MFGAGVESTALAYERLRDTDDELVLITVDNSRHLTGAGRETLGRRELGCARKIAYYLSRSVRPVRHVEVPMRPALPVAGTDPLNNTMYPSRPGYLEITDMYVHWIIEGVVSTMIAADTLGASKALWAYCLWDTESDYVRDFLPFIAGRFPSIGWDLPYLRFEDDGSYSGVGRFELQSRIPDDLFALTVPCHEGVPCGDCWRCRLNAFYDRHCAGKTTEEIRAVDDALHRKYHLGPYVHNADPITYRMLDKYNL